MPGSGTTRREMATVLHYPTNEADLHEGLATLRRMLDDSIDRADPQSLGLHPRGTRRLFHTFRVANRLFGRNGAGIRAPFPVHLATNMAPVETLDFLFHTSVASELMRVAELTRNHILDLIPRGGLASGHRTCPVNALYFRAKWDRPFQTDEKAS